VLRLACMASSVVLRRDAEPGILPGTQRFHATATRRNAFRARSQDRQRQIDTDMKIKRLSVAAAGRHGESLRFLQRRWTHGNFVTEGRRTVTCTGKAHAEQKEART
jgi:hypothetical protein